MEKRRSNFKTILLIIFFPLTIAYGIAWILNRMRFLEVVVICGIGFFYGWRLGTEQLDFDKPFVFDVPVWAELVMAGLLIMMLGLRIMLNAKQTRITR